VTAYPAVEKLVAHRDAMLLIDRVLASTPGGIQVAADVDPHAWYADTGGSMPAWVGVELMAQAVAAWAGLQAWQRDAAPKRGFLLGTRA
jgi:predicted hotdog family 3-hydroxylacyl-ACP dehydratase